MLVPVLQNTSKSSTHRSIGAAQSHISPTKYGADTDCINIQGLAHKKWTGKIQQYEVLMQTQHSQLGRK